MRIISVRMTSSRRVHTQADELVQLKNFEWFVPQAGYRWVKSKLVYAAHGTQPAAAKRAELFLVACSSEAKTSDAKLDDALFREFAETPRTPHGVQSFANRHGWLGVAEPIISTAFQDETVLTSPPRMTPVGLGERIHTWMTEIATMYRLVRVWDPTGGGQAGASHRSEKFDQHIRRFRDEAILYEWVTNGEKGREVIASTTVRPWILDSLLPMKNLDVILRWYLQIAVNEKLAEHGIAISLLWDRKFERLGLTMLPTNLIGFLWLQFAKAIEGRTAYRRCEDCGKWFALGGRSGRADKRFCSGTCKARTHRSVKKLGL